MYTIQNEIINPKEEASTQNKWDKLSELEVEEQINDKKVANYALMAFNDKVFDSPYYMMNYLKAFHDLYNVLKNIGKKYNLLKKIMSLSLMNLIH